MMTLLGRIIIKLSYLLPLSREWHAYIKTFVESVLTDQYQARKYIKKGDIVIDVGGFWGMFAWYAWKKGAAVHVFEPSSDNFKKLRRLAERELLFTRVPWEKKERMFCFVCTRNQPRIHWKTAEESLKTLGVLKALW